jgi:RND family efflux transporter MFP subunit
MEAPWTRDGHVRADVVQVAPDVSGFVTEVLVQDNQRVKRGDILFRIDRARFSLALRQADAIVSGKRASLEEAELDLKRYRALTTEAVSQQRQEQILSTQRQAQAAYDQAAADQAVAQLNLDRSEVHASVNGIITNMDLRPGAYVTSGKGVMALVDTDTLRVEGYFEETKLSRIHVGDPVRISLMGDPRPLSGKVESIAAGIEDRDRGQGTSLLANVNPTFNWVRLAQRIPVRVKLDEVGDPTRLVAGRSATVEVIDRPAGK